MDYLLISRISSCQQTKPLVLPTYLSNYLSIYPSIYLLSYCLSILLNAHLSYYLFYLYPSLLLSIHLFYYLSIYLTIYTSIQISTDLYSTIYLFILKSIYLSIYMDNGDFRVSCSDRKISEKIWFFLDVTRSEKHGNNGARNLEFFCLASQSELGTSRFYFYNPGHVLTTSSPYYPLDINY